MKLRKYSEKQLREAVKNAASMRQVLQILNVAPYGGNYDVLRKAIRHFRLDTLHFTGQAWNKKGGRFLPDSRSRSTSRTPYPSSPINSETDCYGKASLNIDVRTARTHDGSINLFL
jgi:hypothetical protein